MNTLERQMVSLLRRLCGEFHLIGVKGEFEAEGARLEELLRLRDLAGKAEVGMTVKIGGCEAITDLRTARSIGVDQVVAPMIESAFAAKKFLGAAKLVFPADELEELNLLINVETADGVRNFKDICELPDCANLSGLDIGRVDLAGSMGLIPEDCNSPAVFDACRTVCEKWNAVFPKKECTLGGFLNPQTIRFLEAMPFELQIGCESKKTIFAPEVIKKGRLREAFLTAIEFEQLWHRSCMEEYERLHNRNWGYFEMLPNYREALGGAAQ